MNKLLLIGLSYLVFSPMVMADGKALHDVSCLQCHASLTGGKPTSLYTRTDRKVTTLLGLQKRVRGCAIAADANWSDAEQKTVVNYLAKTFYGF